MTGLPKYVYCGVEDPGWELDLDGKVSSPLAAGTIVHLYATGAISATQRVRKSGEYTWNEISNLYAILKRTAYGEFVPKLFSEDKNRFWFYKGLSGEVQGPFTNAEMLEWFRGGYLYEQLKICAVPDAESFPNEGEFCSIEDSLVYLTQPFHSSRTVQQNPLEHLITNGGRKDVLFPFHRDEDLANLPSCCPIAGTLDSTHDKAIENEVDPVESVQEALDQLRPMVLKLFLTDRKRLWYYLGQNEGQHVHGPFTGDLMFSWFQHGWLSESVKVWSTEKEIVRLDRKEFKPLKQFISNDP